MIATIVDTDALWQTVVGATAAGIGTTFVFAIGILGAARFVEASREGRTLEATAFGVLALLGLVATAAAIVIGMIVVASD
jgi:hypothetical protein